MFAEKICKSIFAKICLICKLALILPENLLWNIPKLELIIFWNPIAQCHNYCSFGPRNVIYGTSKKKRSEEPPGYL